MFVLYVFAEGSGSARLLHDATETLVTLEADVTEYGIHGLGQPLKSFRDRAVDFTVYRPESFHNGYLDTLGVEDTGACVWSTRCGAFVGLVPSL